MALNLLPELVYDHSDHRNNLLAIERHLDDDHYVRGFTPGDFVLGGAGAPTHTIITAAVPRWPAIEMVDADTSFAVVSFRKPSEWRSGHIATRYWYTSPVGSTNTFTIQTSMSAIRDGEVVPATALMDVSNNVAGPAVANTLIRSAITYTTTPLGGDDELLTLRILRLGGGGSDTNVNAFHLVYVEITHVPAQRVSQ